MSDTQADPLDTLQDRLTHTFRNPALLTRAVTHLSYLQNHPNEAESNQRLEFLGDAVLQLVLTQALFELYPGDREGSLSKRRAALSKGTFLTQMALEIGLQECLRLGPCEEAAGGRTKSAALEDAFEALIGALFLDSDFPTAKRIILSLYGPLQDRLATVEDVENPKGRLQEIVQPKYGNQALRYEVLNVTGEDHARQYEIAVFLLERQLGSGCGPSKKVAEEAAARVALDNIRDELC